ncbi:2-hydroxy-3-oxopropionate reductase [Alteribacter natronophilus]|uniref:2-hydroxy-3-oxopropionate reductase n=1 Tax=Alteribacter natronophilus TaxID=2583810 RepID=UPI00110F5B40|nr:2-hydroxy-3-oxopropionate reductase [Alteribacter natronophilus]TMW72255.1 2-hydroxy-3-oxopropionate reductase [Alteribacter natronophilus]
MKLGFIGLGIMGQPMVKNLLANNFSVTVTDLNQQALTKAVQEGAVAASSPKEVAQLSDLIFTMLPNSEHVRTVVAGKKGIIEGASEGKIVVDMSSIDPTVSIELSSLLEPTGTDMLDAPVSGGEPKAIDGSLSVMAGGKPHVFEKVKPVLACMAHNITLVGGHGAGSTAKLANQIIVNANIAAVSEAATLAKKAGIDLHILHEAIRGGLAGSAVLDAKLPLMAERNFKPGGRIDINAKDLRNVLAAGDQYETPLPITNQVLSMFEELINEGKAGDDHSGLIQYYENKVAQGGDSK